MASRTSTLKFFSLLISSFAIVQMAMAGDPDILTDFVVPPNGTVDGNFFTYTGFRVLVGGAPPTAFKVLKASLAEFPALDGQSVSYAVLQFPSGTTNPHTLIRAPLSCFSLFRGLVHFQYNADSQKPALAISAFGSANAGLVSIPSTLFTTGIDDNVLAISFKTDVATIQKLKAGLAPKP
ncbi:unnamed protein product [Prunus armeniaca]|uniref:Cupin type-1 domain-containing protein n=1 Tax=Prunus armeniaca TaxID=36596 RepID=A0A6J5V355_PRUAR|nr:unnamed protein product [Prunus armeniaca]